MLNIPDRNWIIYAKRYSIAVISIVFSHSVNSKAVSTVELCVTIIILTRNAVSSAHFSITVLIICRIPVSSLSSTRYA